MCGRFSQLPIDLQAKVVQAMRDADWPDEVPEILAGLPARYNLAPTQKAGVLLDDDGLIVRRLNWRLIPRHEKSLQFKYSTINARIETVAKAWSYRYAFRERRCLVPMAGYFEWTGKPGDKQPWFVHRPDGEPLWAAGIWEPRHKLQSEDDDGSFSIITTTAVDAAGEVHERMPVFLPMAQAETFMRESPEAAMERLLGVKVPPIAIYPVSRRVNAPKDDDAALIEPVTLHA